MTDKDIVADNENESVLRSNCNWIWIETWRLMVPTAIEQEIYSYMQREGKYEDVCGNQEQRQHTEFANRAIQKERVEEAHHSLSVGEGKPLIKEIIKELLSGGRSTRRRWCDARAQLQQVGVQQSNYIHGHWRLHHSCACTNFYFAHLADRWSFVNKPCRHSGEEGGTKTKGRAGWRADERRRSWRWILYLPTSNWFKNL